MQNVRLVTSCAVIFAGTAFTLFVLLEPAAMHPSIQALAFLLPITVVQSLEVDLKWYAPKKTWINDLSQVLNGTDTHGFVFNSSVLPTGTPYSSYNWCNMPHIRATEYPKAKAGFKLEYVEVVSYLKCSARVLLNFE
jgi:hypothetical protein